MSHAISRSLRLLCLISVLMPALAGCSSDMTTAQDEAVAKQRAEAARKAIPESAIGGINRAPQPRQQAFKPTQLGNAK